MCERVDEQGAERGDQLTSVGLAEVDEQKRGRLAGGHVSSKGVEVG
jgi:hypothetical protein